MEGVVSCLKDTAERRQYNTLKLFSNKPNNFITHSVQQAAHVTCRWLRTQSTSTRNTAMNIPSITARNKGDLES